MQYLWINPVSAGMCEEDSLKRFLERHGLTRVECRGDWGRIVRERYEASLRAGVTLADARCPEAVRLLEEIQKEPENESADWCDLHGSPQSYQPGYPADLHWNRICIYIPVWWIQPDLFSQ